MASLSSDTKVYAKENIIGKEVGAETVLLDLDSGYYYTLDEIGSWIWKYFDGDLPLKSIADKISANFEVAKEQALSDLKKLVSDLDEHKLIDLSES